MIRGLLFLLALAAPVSAETVVAGLSQNRVAITTLFDGSEIILFGAVKRESPLSEQPLDVIVTVSGPSEAVTVRRKSRVAGIWVNTASVEVDAAPSFYAVATSAPLSEILSETEDLRHKVSVEQAIRSVGAPQEITDSQTFTEALIRLRADDGAYETIEGSVGLREQTLFDTRIALPANLREGDYATRIFLTRDKQVVDVYETVIFVQKVGLERFLYNLAHDQPLIYGLMSLFIAIAAGWGASTIFSYIRS